MITKRTVLILGAGASVEYGFPVAYDLYTKICHDNAVPPLPDGQQIPEFVKQARDEWRQFREELSQSGQLSVDALLETRPDLEDVGKRAIACGLIRYEQESYLFDPSVCRGPRWYQLLASRLGLGRDEFSENPLSILTFNYDRSLEHFLVVTMSRRYHVTRSDAWSDVQRMPIHHLYGLLGPYCPMGRDGRSYSDDVTFDSVSQSVEHLRIVRDGTGHESVFSTAHQLLQNAEVVLILGFGYDETNLKRLRLDLVPKNVPIYSTAFDLRENEKRRAKDLIGRDITFGDDKTGNAMFLRSHDVLQ